MQVTVTGGVLKPGRITDVRTHTILEVQHVACSLQPWARVLSALQRVPVRLPGRLHTRPASVQPAALPFVQMPPQMGHAVVPISLAAARHAM